MSRIYTGIGSRETPSEILDLMTRIGYVLADQAWTLRSGHAPGADWAFELGALKANGKMEIYLPWRYFNNAPEARDRSPRNSGYIDASTLPNFVEAENIAGHFHPNWTACGQGARKLHTRNVYQVAGEHLDASSDMVICWTKNGKRSGGTGQALRIASHLQIPIFDLAVCSEQDIIKFVNEKQS